MKGSTAIAIAAVVLVAIAIGGIILVQRNAARQQQLTGEQRIGRGVGDLVTGIILVATDSGGDGT